MDGLDKYGIETWYNTEENVWIMAESFDLLIPKMCSISGDNRFGLEYLYNNTKKPVL